MKREAELKAKWAAEMRRSFPGAYILEYSTNGAPDREVVACGITTRYEFKHATPDFVSHDDQVLTCCRIAAAAHCRYVIWQSHRGHDRTLIVRPIDIHRRTGWDVAPESSCVGFDIKWLVEQVRKAHQYGR